MKSIKKSLPESIRVEIRSARREHGWSQLELGRRAHLTQRHISGIETGKIVPRYDTLLEIVRVLGRDLTLVPRELVPAVNALVRDYLTERADIAERSLYADEEDDE